MLNTIKFGVAKDIITPSVSVAMMGFGSVYGNIFQGIHDDLYVRTLMLQDHTNTCLLISMDLCFHEDSLTESIREYACQKHNVPKNNLLITYTHTHYGPNVKGYDDIFINEEYEQFLYQRVTQCIDRAFLNISEGTMDYSSVEGEWNISRRLNVNGVVNPSILPSPDGEVDKSIYILKFTDLNGNIKALLTNFACHPSNLKELRILSSEFPGRLCHLLEAYNYGCTTLFFQGFGADAKLKIGAKSSKFHPISYDECNETASSMALKVQNTLLNGNWMRSDPKLDSRMFQIKMPLDVYPKSVFEKDLQDYSRHSDKRFDKTMINPVEYSGSMLMWSHAQYVVDHYDELPDYLMLNCGVVQLGKNFYIFTVGGEPSYDVKKVLQTLLPNGNILFFGYNDAIAYVPTDKMLKEGGYEAGDRSITEYKMKGKFKAGIDDRFLEGFQKAMDDMI
ncbi:MAG TPA: hypothetical protein DDZ89_16580 [Clostridiales bacterium]|nr:hypothetical protein [Clostridiales bacterium]